MRLLRVYIDGYRNLKNVTVDFDKDSLTTVVIGENGSGKSNLIEAVVEVFRAYDLGIKKIGNFRFEVEYKIRDVTVRLLNTGFPDGTLSSTVDATRTVDGGMLSRADNYLPDLIFGYYSGSGRKLEKLFDTHQSRYYGVINKEREGAEYDAAQAARKLFYCRPIHGVLALLSYLAKPGSDGDVTKLLTEKLGITGFHSALAHFKEPSWFSHGNWQKSRKKADGAGRGRRTYDTLGEQARDIWGARGPAGACARAFRDSAFYPLTMAGKVVDDYRHKPRTEAQLACFLRDRAALESFATKFDTDQDMFAALEAADISDLFREMIVWVNRKNDESGDISFSDLSDGERQLLMVLGLIRVSRGKEALFLLDEPDTHLNPAWQLTYLKLIEDWTDVAAEGKEKCQIIMTTHNPLTIAALTKKEVRVMQKGADDELTVSEPYADPRGLGFTSTLTEIFGLPTTLDPETQKQIDERNRLARLEERSDNQERDLIAINDKLDRLGFMHESRDPLYDDFLKAVQDYKYADRPPMTQDQIEIRRLAMQALIKSLSEDRGKAH